MFGSRNPVEIANLYLSHITAFVIALLASEVCIILAENCRILCAWFYYVEQQVCKMKKEIASLYYFSLILLYFESSLWNLLLSFKRLCVYIDKKNTV